jgi:hypothetical protein
MSTFLLGCVPFVVGGLIAFWIGRKALEAEQRGEPGTIRILAGLVLGASACITLAVLVWESVLWPVCIAFPLLIVVPPVSLVVLIVAMSKRRDVDIAAWALASTTLPWIVLVQNPPTV